MKLSRRQFPAFFLAAAFPKWDDLSFEKFVTWNPPDSLPSAWLPQGGVGAGGLGMVEAHVTADGQLYRWVNNLGQAIKIPAVFSYISAGSGAGGVIYANLEQPSQAADHENFYVHETSQISHRQDYWGPGIICRPGDALTFGMASAPAGMLATVKVLFTF